ncbi:hypothetical protein GCM10027422_43520 [Hymenobacter arcticus]
MAEWLNGCLAALLIGLVIVFKISTIASAKTALSTVLLVVCVGVGANAYLFVRALWQRKWLLAGLCVLVAGLLSVVVAGVMGGLGPNSLGK